MVSICTHPGLGDGGACGVEAYLGTHTLNSVSRPESLRYTPKLQGECALGSNIVSPGPQMHRASQVVLVVKNSRANARDIRGAGLIPVSGRSPGGGHGNPLQ